ncbi:FAD-binding oxidoreductase [Devosia sp.]|uniref:NAD(P)/FAD-dependent oxidoreductase n=1 Tax=Devosia sp. TaxID=1871048 RepID=UPI001AD2C3DA|nr:FAD-binding oxidoreductase [Devosia sp.]MBN9333944.1 FAD-binding oxidoreductase [Devosia sp.]
MKAIVIGGGVIGAAVCYRLAEAGTSVTLVEAGRVAEGTSLTSFAWVSACEKIDSDSYFRLSLAGVAAHRDLVAEFGAAGNWYHRPGVIQWLGAGYEGLPLAESPLHQKLSRLAALGYSAERIGRDDLARLEPCLRPEALDIGEEAIHYPEDGYVEAPVMIGALVEAAVARFGMDLRTQTPVRRLITVNGRAAGVETATGEVFYADVVINCAGRWANDVVGSPDFTVPLAPTLGLIAYTPAVGTAIRKVLRTPNLNVRADGGGRLLLRANDMDETLSADDVARPDHPAAIELARRLGDLIPSLGGIHAEAARIATRPIPQGGLPCVGTLPGLDNYWVAVTHGGINTSAFIGIALRDEILRGQQAPEYAPYRPERFFKAAA